MGFCGIHIVLEQIPESMTVVIFKIQSSLSLSICGGLVPEPSMDTKVRGCSSLLYKVGKDLHIIYI